MVNTGDAVSHIVGSLCGEMGKAGASVSYGAVGHFGEGAREGRGFERLSPPKWATRVIYRLGRDPKGWLERKFVSAVRGEDVVWLWPGVSDWVYDAMVAKGVLVVSERINCHRAMAQRILWSEYDRLGLPRAGGYGDGEVSGETRKLMKSRAVFAPSPMVAKSLEEVGIGPERILRSSYGWDPGRIGAGRRQARERGGAVVFVFVGLGCVRKGLHLLLDAWARKRFSAKLRIVGSVTEEIEKLHGETLRRSDVELTGFVPDVGAMMATSDVFVFPSLEEGGPLVTYEAMAVGLPSIVSPMAAGAVVVDGIHGMVIDPHDASGWAAAMERMVASAELREEMGRAAAEHAKGYTWSEVAKRRLGMLRALVGNCAAAV